MNAGFFTSRAAPRRGSRRPGEPSARGSPLASVEAASSGVDSLAFGWSSGAASAAVASALPSSAEESAESAAEAVSSVVGAGSLSAAVAWPLRVHRQSPHQRSAAPQAQRSLQRPRRLTFSLATFFLVVFFFLSLASTASPPPQARSRRLLARPAAAGCSLAAVESDGAGLFRLRLATAADDPSPTRVLTATFLRLRLSRHYVSSRRVMLSRSMRSLADTRSLRPC